MSKLGEICGQVARHLGFPHFLYGLRIAVSLSNPNQIVLSGYPVGWREHYDEQGYMAVDPVLARSVTSVAAFSWDEVERKSPAAQRLFDDAEKYGLRHGVTVPVHGANGEFGLMSFARPNPLPEGVYRNHLLQRAQWLTVRIQERMRHLALNSKAPREPRLTAREQECLRHAAHGLKTSAIAGAMHIAESTVVYHLNAAERKLGVTRRGHAIARAVALGAVEAAQFPSRISASKLIEFDKR